MNERGKRMTTTTTANGRKKGRQTGRKGLDDGSRERKKKRRSWRRRRRKNWTRDKSGEAPGVDAVENEPILRRPRLLFNGSSSPCLVKF